MNIDVIIDFVIVVVSIIMLWKGADWLVDSAAEIAHTFKISDLIIGLTVVAFGTSAPEFCGNHQCSSYKPNRHINWKCNWFQYL